MSNIDDRIWITSRVRMISEQKALRNQTASYITVTYYSLFTIIVSIFADYYIEPYPRLSQITLAASVVVLVASLVAGGFRFETRASVFRECYLKLQKLGDEGLSDPEKKIAYSEILADFPNHSNNDYYDVIINHTCWEKKTLTSDGKPLKPSLYMWISYLGRRVFYYGALTLLYIAPIVFLVAPLMPRC